MKEKNIIHKLATKYNLPLKEVEKIIFSQFKFVSKIMSDGNFDTIRLPYFGKFHVNKGRLKYIQKKNGSTNSK